MNLSKYAEFDGVALGELVRSREVSREELYRVAQEAIDVINPQLNFLAHDAPGVARECLDADIDGPFAGVPFLVKEAPLKGQPNEWGSRQMAGHLAEEDGEIVKRFRASGVTIVGISTMPEAGNAPTTEAVLYGPTRNPWNTDYMPGGSSGGAAAAVASGVMPIAHASDGGGSIRIPAACCGLVGLKPTRARTPGMRPTPFSPGVGHVVSRTLRDTAAMLDCIHGSEPGGIYYTPPVDRPFRDELAARPAKLRIAFSAASPSGAPLDPELVNATEKAAQLCEALGHDVEEAAPRYDWAVLLDAFSHLWSFSHSYSNHVITEATGRAASAETREACNMASLRFSQEMKVHDFDRALRDLHAQCVIVDRFFEQYDVFISPVTTRPALPLGELDANAEGLTAQIWADRMLSHYALFTPIFNVTGQPAVSLPLYQSKDGLPLGVQFAGRFGDEAALFRLGAQLEAALPWCDRRPPVFVS